MKLNLTDRLDGPIVDTIIEFETRDGELLYAMHTIYGGWLVGGWDWEKLEVYA